MRLFQMTYERKGQKGIAHLTLCRTGIVSATELAAKLASSWHLANWEIKQVPFAKHTRRKQA